MKPKTILAWTVPITFVAVIAGLALGENRQLTESAVAAMAAILGAIVNGIMSNRNGSSKVDDQKHDEGEE